jgi:hypothetical protein
VPAEKPDSPSAIHLFSRWQADDSSRTFWLISHLNHGHFKNHDLAARAYFCYQNRIGLAGEYIFNRFLNSWKYSPSGPQK